jgi:splicing factor U2AF subunit
VHRSSRDDRDRRGGDRDRYRERDDRERDRGDRGGDYDRRDRRDYERERERRHRERADGGDRDRGGYDRDRRRDDRGEDRYNRDDRRGGAPPGGMVASSMREDRGPPGGGHAGGRDFGGHGGYGGPPREDRRRGGGGGGGGRDRRGRDDDREFENGPLANRKRSPTPENAVPLSERQRLGPTRWDERPPGFEGVSAYQAKQTGKPFQMAPRMLISSCMRCSSSGQFPAPGPNRQPIPAMFGNPGFPGAPGFQGASVFNNNGAATGGVGNPMRQSKRLYVGNIQLTCNEQILADFFNHKMKEQAFAVDMPGEPVTSIQLNHEKSYAFVEVSI